MTEGGLNKKQTDTLRFIRNIVMHKGSSPSVRDIKDHLGYKSPRSAAILLDQLVDLGYLKKDSEGKLKIKRYLPSDEDVAQTVDVPLVGSAACGTPIFAEENIEAYFKVSTEVAKPPYKYFILRAQGDSMDKVGIEDGDLVLIRQQNTAENRQQVVALIDNEATIKEFNRAEEAIVLKPNSTNTAHRPIILETDFQIQGVVVQTIPKSSLTYNNQYHG